MILDLLGMLTAVLLILALAYAATRLVGKYGTGLPGAARMGDLYVLRQILVGRAERLVLVRVRQKCLLLGVAQGGISVLAELSEEDSAKWLSAPEPVPATDFLTALRKSVEKKK